MKSLIVRFPFTIAAIVGVALSSMLTKYGVEYDSGGSASVLFYLALALQFPVLIAHELVHGVQVLKLNNHWNVLVLVLGLFFSLSIDLLLLRGIRKFKKAR